MNKNIEIAILALSSAACMLDEWGYKEAGLVSSSTAQKVDEWGYTGPKTPVVYRHMIFTAAKRPESLVPFTTIIHNIAYIWFLHRLNSFIV